MKRIWSRTEHSELYEKRLKKSFIYREIDRDRDDECAEKWSPETMSLHIECSYDDCEYYEHDRDIAHDLREAIEHSSVSSLESLDERVFEMVEGGEERHDLLIVYIFYLIPRESLHIEYAFHELRFFLTFITLHICCEVRRYELP